MQGALELVPLRTRIYIDGFNLYYGCLKGTPYKWLDLQQLFQYLILPSALFSDANGHAFNSELLLTPSIKFFTAKIVLNVAKSEESVSSQARYHTALRKLYPDNIEIIEGYYSVDPAMAKMVDLANPKWPPKNCQTVKVWKVEEKQSDVNLALHAYHDAITGQIDHAVFVTNDTDIAPSLKMIKTHTTVKIGIVTPTIDSRTANTDLKEHADWHRTHITAVELKNSQLPRVIPGRKPTIKPESWYANPDKFAQILKQATVVKGRKSEAYKWLDQPCEYLSGDCPIDLIETIEGAERVLAYIGKYIADTT